MNRKSWAIKDAENIYISTKWTKKKATFMMKTHNEISYPAEIIRVEVREIKKGKKK